MQNIKYHSINIVTVLIFSYTMALTINEVIKYNILPPLPQNVFRRRAVSMQKKVRSFEFYQNIIDKGFFQIPSVEEIQEDSGKSVQVSSLDNLKLMGTITGSWSIARAMIKKRGEKNPEIFALRKINADTGNDVYGYTLTKIMDTKVLLKRGEQTYILDMFAKKQTNNPNIRHKNSRFQRKYNKRISRAEIQQKVMNNLDNAMKGLIAGPYRVNGRIVGFKLKRVRPYNILYKLGARSGDIVKRINGHAVNSTAKMFKMWQTLKSESKISVDLERAGQIVTFDLNITE